MYQDLEPINNFSIGRSVTLLLVFLTITPLVLGISLFSLFSLVPIQKGIQHPQLQATRSLTKTPQSGIKVYASLPTTFPKITGTIQAEDARSALVRGYLKRYESPLEPYSGLVVQTADKYSLDYRLIVAIAQQESNLCKIIPPGSHNCWGYGIHSRGSLGFASYEEGIETVSAGLKKNYIDIGLTTPDLIMTKYTPLSNGSWALGVNAFMAEMD